MVLLAAVSRLPLGVIATLGLVMIAGHDMIPGLLGEQRAALLARAWGPLLRVLYFGGGISFRGGQEPSFFVLYSLVPWWGVMCVGFAFGKLMTGDAAARRNWCVRIGVLATALFMALRATQLYGDRPWVPAPGESPWAPGWIMFLSTTKYPASLQFLLMTLGPTLVAIGVLEGVTTRFTRWLSVFGRVPMFYYLLHIPLIHVLALVLAAIRTPQALGWLFGNHPLLPPSVPDGYMWPLPLLYAATIGAVQMLHPLCRGYDKAKAERRWRWTAYI